MQGTVQPRVEDEAFTLSEVGRRVKAILTGSIGNLVEWYDFYVFATASALVFGPLFFPSGDSQLSTMASFGAFASGFLARPLGGLIFGDIGDRIGRKASSSPL